MDGRPIIFTEKVFFNGKICGRIKTELWVNANSIRRYGYVGL